MGGGGFSRGGVARGGSMRSQPRPQPSPRPYESRSTRTNRSDRREARPPSATTQPGDSRSRQGSFETRRGETVEWETEVSRGEDGLQRETSWESTSGASGSGSSTASVQDGQVTVDRTRHAQTASGETIDRSWSAQREGDWIVRDGSVRTSTGVDADTRSAIRRTDDGFIAHGAASGREGDFAGTVVKKGDELYGRGMAVEGDDVTWGRIHCEGERCTGGRVTADLDDYYDYPYYYYPYYYGWYSCPPGHVDVWHGAYGTPVYGCDDVVVVSTTISLGPSDPLHDSAASSLASGSSTRRDSDETHVTSRPVLMYEVEPEIVVYSTDARPEGVYAIKRGKRYFWAPGPKQTSPRLEGWISRASAMKAPTANATVISYEIDGRLVYLTNERPVPGFFAESSDQLFAWMPGVYEPSKAEREAIETAIATHRAGGRRALDREARKLEAHREPPPQSPPRSGS